jgi:hypothetical protein
MGGFSPWGCLGAASEIYGTSFQSCRGRVSGDAAPCAAAHARSPDRRFLTPTAYVVYTAKGEFLSHPSVGFQFVDAPSVIGYIETFNVTEGFANRAVAGNTRSVVGLGLSYRY